MESEAIYKLWLPRLAKFLTVCKLTLAILPLSVSSSVRKNTVIGVEMDFKYKKQTLDDMNNSTDHTSAVATRLREVGLNALQLGLG